MFDFLFLLQFFKYITYTSLNTLYMTTGYVKHSKVGYNFNVKKRKMQNELKLVDLLSNDENNNVD